MPINHPALLDILSGRAGLLVHRWVEVGSDGLLVLQIATTYAERVPMRNLAPQIPIPELT